MSTLPLLGGNYHLFSLLPLSRFLDEMSSYFLFLKTNKSSSDVNRKSVSHHVKMATKNDEIDWHYANTIAVVCFLLVHVNFPAFPWADVDTDDDVSLYVTNIIVLLVIPGVSESQGGCACIVCGRRRHICIHERSRPCRCPVWVHAREWDERLVDLGAHDRAFAAQSWRACPCTYWHMPGVSWWVYCKCCDNLFIKWPYIQNKNSVQGCTNIGLIKCYHYTKKHAYAVNRFDKKVLFVVYVMLVLIMQCVRVFFFKSSICAGRLLWVKQFWK